NGITSATWRRHCSGAGKSPGKDSGRCATECYLSSRSIKGHYNRRDSCNAQDRDTHSCSDFFSDIPPISLGFCLALGCRNGNRNRFGLTFFFVFILANTIDALLHGDQLVPKHFFIRHPLLSGKWCIAIIELHLHHAPNIARCWWPAVGDYYVG